MTNTSFGARIAAVVRGQAVTQTQRRVFDAIYAGGMTEETAAAALKMNESEVNAAHCAVLRRLRGGA